MLCCASCDCSSVISYMYICIFSPDLTVEQVEPIIVAVMEQSLEFALCCLEKSVATSDDISFIQVCNFV